MKKIPDGRTSTIREIREFLQKELSEDLVLLILMIEQWPSFIERQVFYPLDDKTLDPERDGEKTFNNISLYEHVKTKNEKWLVLKLNILYHYVSFNLNLYSLNPGFYTVKLNLIAFWYV